MQSAKLISCLTNEYHLQLKKTKQKLSMLSVPLITYKNPSINTGMKGNINSGPDLF